MKKYIPNMITSVRLALAITLFFLVPYKTVFIVLYLFAGLTDNVDGYVARKTKTVSAFGAKLDTVSDLTLFSAGVVAAVNWFTYPGYIWTIAIVLGGMRVGNMILGYLKYKKFISIHSIANKAAGILLFLVPIIPLFWPGLVYPFILISVSFLATAEETVMFFFLKNPDWDAKSIITVLKARKLAQKEE